MSILKRQKFVIPVAVVIVVLAVVATVSHVHKQKQKILVTESSVLRISSEQHSQSLVPIVGDYQCQDSICSEFLSAKEKERCTRKCKDIIPEKCHFINGTGRAPVALASYPGSGNTWVRGLLEKATGVCTGAIYCDGSIRCQGFAGEGKTTGAVLAVKTHFSYDVVDLKVAYGAAIHLVRNPLGVLVSEYNRKNSNRSTQVGSKHVSSLEQDKFGNYSSWDRFIHSKAKRWKLHFTGWVNKFSKIPVLRVRYEDIKKDRVREVKRMLEFLGVPYSEEELKERLSEDFDLFHRRKHEDFDPYTPEQREYVNQQIREAVDTVRANNNGDTLGFEVYLNN